MWWKVTWNHKTTKRQRLVYYLLYLIFFLPTIIAAISTENATLFSSYVFFFFGVCLLIEGIYAGFYLKDFPKIFPDLVKIEGLSAQLKGILHISIGILGIYVSTLLRS